jgi:histidinol phosphatase-like PHP family hydrolase
MTVENCLAAAEKLGYKSLCVTNHTWDNLIPGASDWYKPQDVEHGCLDLPLPQGKNTRFYFGCETEFTENGLAMSPEHFDVYDFIAVPLNHFHMEGLVRSPEIKTVEQVAELFLHRIEMFSSLDIPYEKFGVAHMTCSLMKRDGDTRDVLNAISDSDFTRVYTKLASLGCGIELNCNDFKIFSDNIEPLLRIYRIAKKCGCRFYLGSDAHVMEKFTSAQETLNEVISALNLTDGDRFIIPER